ncbi:unnamed protein product [Brassica rapa subsp. trilocularis]|uniref:(rape) hypothetical protein n=1 Tax=Brassica napus TaxID=3708 RepID=A0A816XMY5_BRANA|nr:unnamed protein product [Brassica napus]
MASGPSITVHLGPVSARFEHDHNYRNLEQNEEKELGCHKVLRTETESNSYLKDSQTSIRKPTLSQLLGFNRFPRLDLLRR